jgi:hypothetical protein
VNALAGTSAGSAEDEWDTFVKQVQSALNCTYNKSIAVSSLEALAGYKPRHVANSNIVSAVQDDLSRMDLAKLRSKIHQRIAKDQKAQKERFDKTRAATTKYVKGQLVMVSNAVSSTGTSKKLLFKFKGPLRVRTVLEGRTNPFTKGTDGCTYYRSFCVVAFLLFFFDRLFTLPLFLMRFLGHEALRTGYWMESDDDSRLRLELVRGLLFSSFFAIFTKGGRTDGRDKKFSLFRSHL